jgi:WS/DGAT/MGAT family acyltransferase
MSALPRSEHPAPARPRRKALPAPERERMSGVDVSWLRMERPANPMAITSVMTFRQRLNVQRVRRTLREQFLAFGRFQQRPVEEASGHYWETDPKFDLDRHLHRVALPGAGGKRELQDLVSDLASTPLDPGHPMWQFHLIERYRGSGSALVARIHHCYADGVALMRVLLALTDGDAGPVRRRGHAGTVAGWLPWLEPLTSASAKLLQWTGAFWQGYFEMLLRPAKALELAQAGTGFVVEAAKLLAMSPEPATRFRGEPGLSKRAAWTEGIALAQVKAVARSLDCSVNDVLLACAAGALRAYLAAHRDALEGLEIRVVVPVNLRSSDADEPLGNQFGMVFLELPLGMANPLERLYAVHQRMLALRHSPQPMLLLGLLNFAGVAPRAVHEQLLQTLGAHATAVMTNVPGPQRRLRFAGAEIDEQIFWVPQSGNIGMGASLLSYAGHVQFGLITDAGMVPDPERIVERFPVEFAKLKQAASGRKVHP